MATLRTETGKSHKKAKTGANGKATGFEGKVSLKEFVEKVIKAKRKAPYKGVHVVFSGFNEYFREYYGFDPRQYIDQLVEEGFLTKVVTKGGAIITLTSDLTEEEKASHANPRGKIQKELKDILK